MRKSRKQEFVNEVRSIEDNSDYNSKTSSILSPSGENFSKKKAYVDSPPYPLQAEEPFTATVIFDDGTP